MDDVFKKAVRDFKPKTEFTSLFGAKDIVNDKDKHYEDNGDIFVLGKIEYRLIYNGSYWADIIN